MVQIIREHWQLYMQKPGGNGKYQNIRWKQLNGSYLYPTQMSLTLALSF